MKKFSLMLIVLGLCVQGAVFGAAGGGHGEAQILDFGQRLKNLASIAPQGTVTPQMKNAAAKVLNVAPDADEAVIIKAGRVLSRAFHPDRFKGSADAFKLVQLASDTLKQAKEQEIAAQRAQAEAAAQRQAAADAAAAQRAQAEAAAQKQAAADAAAAQRAQEEAAQRAQAEAAGRSQVQAPRAQAAPAGSISSQQKLAEILRMQKAQRAAR